MSMKQSSRVPTQKVIASAITGLVMIGLSLALRQIPGTEEFLGEGGQIEMLVSTVVTFVVAYYVPPAERDQIEEPNS